MILLLLHIGSYEKFFDYKPLLVKKQILTIPEISGWTFLQRTDAAEGK